MFGSHNALEHLTQEWNIRRKLLRSVDSKEVVFKSGLTTESWDHTLFWEDIYKGNNPTRDHFWQISAKIYADFLLLWKQLIYSHPPLPVLWPITVNPKSNWPVIPWLLHLGSSLWWGTSSNTFFKCKDIMWLSITVLKIWCHPKTWSTYCSSKSPHPLHEQVKNIGPNIGP